MSEILEESDLDRAERHLRRADPVLAEVVEAVGPCRIDEARRDRPFPALIESILHQQLSMKAAATIHRRFLALYDGRPPSPRELLDTPESDLRAAGLSRQKVGYLRDLAERVAAGSLSMSRLPDLDDEEVIDVLTEVKGVGRWTAEMFLMFRLGRADVLPVGDLGLRDAVRRVYGLDERPGPEEMRRIAEPWRPYRSIACWYLWRSRRAGGLAPTEAGDGGEDG